MTKPTEITLNDGTVSHVVLPVDDYRQLRLLARPDLSGALPLPLVKRILAGESPVRVWRHHRGLKQADLMARTGLGRTAVHRLEAEGTDHASVAILKRLARALDVEPEDLIID